MEANTETTSNKIKFEGSQRNAGQSRFQMTKSVGAIFKGAVGKYCKKEQGAM